MGGSVYSVGQVNSYVKNLFDNDFMLSRIQVRGEVSNCRYHVSGHVYFSLKDDEGVMSCVMFAGNRGGLGFRMEDGQNVVAKGRISVYEKGGTYQLYAESIRLDGIGQLYLRFEELKRSLEEMGMFAPEYKRPIPVFASRVGIVTAGTGAAVRDIITIAKRRNPYVSLVLYPALVQGDGAAESIVAGIRALDRLGVDVLIVGRGGGSIEDLWAFNEEMVARAIFDCGTPVISAVGHETDFTIADFVADMRAPTPSAAAELAVYERARLDGYVADASERLRELMEDRIREGRSRLEQLGLRLTHQSPAGRLKERKERRDRLALFLRERMEAKWKENALRLQVDAARLDALSPMKKLAGGYSYVTVGGQALLSVEQVKTGDEIEVNVKDGVLTAVVDRRKRMDRRTEHAEEESGEGSGGEGSSVGGVLCEAGRDYRKP